MNIKDAFGIGKVLPIEKLLDVLSSALGRVTKTYFYRRDADAKAYEIGQLAKANAEGLKIMAAAIQEVGFAGNVELRDGQLALTSSAQSPIINETTELSLVDRGQNRLEYQEAKKQLNIESITAFAAEELSNEESVTDEPLDEDWTTRFFKIAEDISNEEMQALWGRVLAGEIKQPKSFSLRTLEVLRNLSKEEAEVFTKFAKLRISSQALNMIYNYKGIEENYGITFGVKLLLVELGLISGTDPLLLDFPATAAVDRRLLKCGDKGIIVTRQPNVKSSLEIISFTKTGSELANLIVEPPPIDYIKGICLGLHREGIQLIYGELLNTKDGEGIKNTFTYKPEN